MTQKIVINKVLGSFAVSLEATKFMAERGSEGAKAVLSCWGGIKDAEPEQFNWSGGLLRDDPDLVAAVEALRGKASTRCSTLVVVEIPDDIEWFIEDYNGKEWVAEYHRTWGAEL